MNPHSTVKKADINQDSTVKKTVSGSNPPGLFLEIQARSESNHIIFTQDLLSLFKYKSQYELLLLLNYNFDSIMVDEGF